MIRNFNQYIEEKLTWNRSDERYKNFLKLLGIDSKKRLDKFLNSVLGDLGFSWKDTKLSFIDSGAFGYVFQIDTPVLDKDCVLKFTYDINEYNNVVSILKKNLKYIANYYEARQIKGVDIYPAPIKYTDTSILTLKNPKLYVLLLEKLEPVNGDAKSLDNLITYWNVCDQNLPQAIKYFNEKKLKIDFKTAYSYLIELDEIKTEAIKYNIPTIEIAYRNVGIKNGHLGWFDIGGLSNSKPDYNRDPIEINFPL